MGAEDFNARAGAGDDDRDGGVTAVRGGGSEGQGSSGGGGCRGVRAGQGGSMPGHANTMLRDASHAEFYQFTASRVHRMMHRLGQRLARRRMRTRRDMVVVMP